MKNSTKDLEERKNQLKKELGEMEALLRFENPRKSWGAITGGVSEQYLGKILDTNLGSNILTMVGDLLKNSVKLGSVNMLGRLTKKKITPLGVGKGLLVAGLVVATPIIARTIKKKLEHYRKRETAKSIGKLI